MSLIPTKIKHELIDFIFLLTKQQTRSGAWIENNPSLQSVILTCQSTLLLCKFRGSIVEKSLNKSVSWLTRADIATYEYSYWRLLPILRAKINGQLASDIKEQVRKKIEVGLLHHENSPLKGYYIECCIQLNEIDSTVREILNEWFDQVSNNSQEMPPERITYILANYPLIKSAPNRKKVLELAPALLEVISTKGTYRNNTRFWSNLVSTAYITLNLVQIYKLVTDNKAKKIAHDLMQESTLFLTRMWELKNFESDPLAGGDFQQTDYAKIIVARALVEVADWEDSGWREEAWVNNYDKIKNRHHTVLFILIGFALIILAQFIRKISISQTNSIDWLIVAKIADIIAIGSIALPFLTKIIKRLRK